MPVKSRKGKQSIYFPVDMLAELEREAARQERSVAWLLQTAWRVSRAQMAKLPRAPEQ